MYTDNNDHIWVHERDYGENPIGDFLAGFFFLISGIVTLAVALFRRKS